MRFNLLARRIMAAALGLALAATVAACSSSGSSSATSPASSSSAPVTPSTPASSSAPGTSASATGSGNSAATAAIKTNWEMFFNGKTSAAKKITLLQNGQKYASIIQAQAGSGLASGAGAQVTAVVVNSATSATVSYNITLNGTPALSNQTGTAVYENGTWKVGDVSFCQLLKLENNGTAPSVCSG
jgi:hypothetical protein